MTSYRQHLPAQIQVNSPTKPTTNEQPIYPFSAEKIRLYAFTHRQIAKLVA
jgi:hypothetical protein